MQAVVFTPEGEQLAEVADPRPQPDEVLLKVEYCGICGSDLHAGEPDFHHNTVMGHEFSATVVEPGSAVTGFSIGDHVVVNPNGDWCGSCPACVSGSVNMCPNIWPTVVGLARNGGLAPYTAVRSRVLHHLPESVGLKSGAWVEPVAVALRSIHNSGISIGQDAVVFGGGPIGLLITSILAASGAARITVVEPTPSRRSMAIQQGATDVVDPSATSVEEYFADQGAPAFAFECSGVAALVAQAVSVLKPHGRLTVTGFSRKPPSFDAADLLFKEISIQGSFIYVSEFAEAIRLLERRRINVESLISGIVPVAQASTAFEQMRTSPDAIKYLISDFH